MGLAVQYAKAGVNGGHADRLSDVALADAGVAEQQNVFMLLDKPAAGQVEDQRAIERVELPVEGVERLAGREIRRLLPGAR